MNFYQIVRIALSLIKQQGTFATARFLKRQGVCAEDRRKLLAIARRPLAAA